MYVGKHVRKVDDLPYVGKHAKINRQIDNFKVWRVLGPAGPEETLTVRSLREAAEKVLGCWDYEVYVMCDWDMDVLVPSEALDYEFDQIRKERRGAKCGTT